MSLRSKADLQTTKNKLNEVSQELTTLKRWIEEKNTQLDKQSKVTTQLNQELNQKKEQIDQKDNIIHLREKNILTLKKRTQELEKFKFVLDEKI